MKIFYYEFLIFFLFTFQQNIFNNELLNSNITYTKHLNNNIFNRNFTNFKNNIYFNPYIKNEDNKEELNITLIQEEIKNSNLSNIIQDNIFNLTQKMNAVIKNALNIQEEIYSKAESDNAIIKNMLEEIEILKQRYKRNIIFSYILGALILLTLFIFYCSDSITTKKGSRDFGYQKPEQIQNNNQLDID